MVLYPTLRSNLRGESLRGQELPSFLFLANFPFIIQKTCHKGIKKIRIPSVPSNSSYIGYPSQAYSTLSHAQLTKNGRSSSSKRIPPSSRPRTASPFRYLRVDIWKEIMWLAIVKSHRLYLVSDHRAEEYVTNPACNIE